MRTPGPESCSCSLGGGIHESTLGSTLSSGILRGDLVILSRLGLRTCGAGIITSYLGTVNTNGGALVILSGGSTFTMGDVTGVPNTGSTRVGAVGACSVVGTSALMVIGNTMTGLRRMCTW